MRLIDADALIEFIENRYDITWENDYEGGIKDACVDILEEIYKMPTIEPSPKWIPVTERLPEEDGTYIVCLEDGSVFEYGYITNWYDDVWEYCKKDVVAWMPRPKLYREDEQDE